MKYNEHVLFNVHQTPVIKTFRSSAPRGKHGFTEHRHTECELSLFIFGRGRYSLNGRSYDFSTGDMFLFGSDEPHCITELFTSADILNIRFEPRILWEDPDNIELLKLFFERNENFSNKINKIDTKLSKMILDIENEAQQKYACSEIQTKCLLLTALIHIFRSYNCTARGPYSQNFETIKNLKEAMLYIDSNIENKITLENIAAKALMSQNDFSSVFKKFNGISPWEYINIKRVEKAISLIKTTDMTKLEIAEACGFSTPASFYKAFLEVTGKRLEDYMQT